MPSLTWRTSCVVAVGLSVARQPPHRSRRALLRHRALQKIEEGTGLCFQLAAGACYGGSDWANAFNLIDVDLGAQRLKVQPWLWQEGRWKADRNRSHPGFSLRQADAAEKGQFFPPRLGQALPRVCHVRLERFSRCYLSDVWE